MPCDNPRKVWIRRSGVDRRPLFSKPSPSTLFLFDETPLPCGGCTGCRLDQARTWATRIQHEVQMHDENAFVTLTFSDEHYPEDGSIRKVHLQKFIKRLRDAIKPQRVRFYGVGEYGETTKRAHYHVCLFGYNPSDLKPYRKGKHGHMVYTSESLDKIWGFGKVFIGELNYSSGGYVARYCMKKLRGDGMGIDPKTNLPYYFNYLNPETGELREREFAAMSSNPGIGRAFFEEYCSDMYPEGQVVINGKQMPVPRYYDKLYAKCKPESMEAIKEKRKQAQKDKADDNTPERLAVKVEVRDARIKSLRREDN